MMADCTKLLISIQKGAINDWKVKGWKQKAHWGFLSEPPIEGGPMPPLAKEVFKDGKLARPLKKEEWLPQRGV